MLKLNVGIIEQPPLLTLINLNSTHNLLSAESCFHIRNLELHYPTIVIIVIVNQYKPNLFVSQDPEAMFFLYVVQINIARYWRSVWGKNSERLTRYRFLNIKKLGPKHQIWWFGPSFLIYKSQTLLKHTRDGSNAYYHDLASA